MAFAFIFGSKPEDGVVKRDNPLTAATTYGTAGVPAGASVKEWGGSPRAVDITKVVETVDDVKFSTGVTWPKGSVFINDHSKLTESAAKLATSDVVVDPSTVDEYHVYVLVYTRKNGEMTGTSTGMLLPLSELMGKKPEAKPVKTVEAVTSRGCCC